MFIRDHWEGNYTFDINRVIKANESYSTSTTFTVPNDGRVSGLSSARIDVAMRIDGSFTSPRVTYPEHLHISIVSSPVVVSNMDTLILLMAVLIILIVVCTALVAAAIFLSTRKPHETYAEPPKIS